MLPGHSPEAWEEGSVAEEVSKSDVSAARL